MRVFSSLTVSVMAAVCVDITACGGQVKAQGSVCDGIEPVAGGAITLELVTAALSRPVDVQAIPGDIQRLFVVEQRGTIRIVNLATNAVNSQAFLDISTRVLCNPCSGGQEQGMLGLAFHPDYAENGFFYVNYVRSSDSRNVISRFEVSKADPNRADATESVVIAIDGFEGNHNAGQLAFGPNDGFLYVATGDGGGSCDEHGSISNNIRLGNSQNPQSLLGKMLRLDVDSGSPYAIPADNPFRSSTDGILDEIWALGIRNGWRFAFDSETGDMYIGDVGQGRREEIDFQPGASIGAENYGWRTREGTQSSTVSGCSNLPPLGPGTVQGPILEYPHSGGTYSGCSITGGVVYRGCRMPDLHGTYFFADYCTPWVRTFRVEGGSATDLRDRTADLNDGLSSAMTSIVSFGVDARGEVYITNLGGRLLRVVPLISTNKPPAARIVTTPAPAVVTLFEGSANVLLDGTTSDDGGDGPGEALGYLWEKTSGPAGDAIARALKESTGVTFTGAGDYIYRLTVNDGADSATAEVTVTVNEPPPPLFRRGDANGDRSYDVSDAVYILNHLFLGSPVIVPCEDALDADGDGEVILTDAVFYLNNRFLGGPEIPAPHPDCGPDDNPQDLLGCDLPPCTS